MINTIDGILEAAKGGKTGVIAVAAAHDEPVIEAVVEARKEGIATPILVGHVAEIEEMLRKAGEDPVAYEIIAGDTDQDCAAKAVALCAEGKANFLMKGILGTADLMRAVFNKEHGLRTSHLTTHCMFYEIPALGRMLILTDGGVNTFPDLDKKAEILENAAMVLQALGYEHINASCVCGAEQVNPKVQSTVDADALSKMTDRWAKYNMDVCGPVALDLACAEAINRQPVLPNSAITDLKHEHDCDRFHAAHDNTHWQDLIEHGKKLGIGQDTYELVTIR